MIPLTRTQRIAYALFAETVLLLLLYAALALLTAVKFLGDDPLAGSLPYSKVSSWANVLLHLTVLTGLLGGGIYAIATTRSDNRLHNQRLLVWGLRLWTALLVLATFAGFFGLLEGRHMMELPPLLDAALVLLLALFLFCAVQSIPAWEAIPTVWLSGMGLSMLCTLVGLLPAADFVQDRALRSLAAGLNWNVALLLAGAALGFWLMHRFSNLTPAWINQQLYIVAGLLALAGTLVTIAGLQIPGGAALAQVGGSLALFVVPVLLLIFAVHAYKALASRNSTATLAAHWFGLGLLLLLLGIGLLGSLTAPGSVQQWTLGTRLSDLQFTLTALGVVALVLGVVNQATAELRGQNRRVTGLMPFWLVAFGIVGGALALGGAGLVQVYMERFLTLGYLETQRLLVPLFALWSFGWLLAALGFGIYALGFIARRPEVPLE